MTIARQYLMIAQDNQTAELRNGLVALAAKVCRIEGCEGVGLFQDEHAPARFTFIEYWTSSEAHRIGGKQLGKEVFAPILAVTTSPPERTDLEQIKL